MSDAIIGGIGVAGTVGAALIAPVWIALFMAAAMALAVVAYTARRRAVFAVVALIFAGAGTLAFIDRGAPGRPDTSHRYAEEQAELGRRIDRLVGERPKQRPLSPLLDDIPIRSLAPIRLATLAYINRLRDHYGLRPVTESAYLNRVAQRHVQRILETNTLDHQIGDEPTLGDQVGTRFSKVGEVIGATSRRSRWTEMIDVWIASKGHRSVLLTPTNTKIGVGVEMESGRPWESVWTVILAHQKSPAG